MADYIRYFNQGATRSRPLNDDLIKRLAYLQDMGITAHVISGGQPGKDEGGPRTGSIRHDHGNSMDADFYIGDRKLDWNNPDDLPIFQQIVSRGKAAGISGIGGADDYMGAGRLHMGFGEPSRWGAGGKSANAPAWLASAYDGTEYDPSTKPVAMAAAKPQPSPVSDNPLMASVQAKMPDAKAAEPAKPESHNGILVNAFNKLTGADYQVPDTILGAKTGDVMKGIGGIGDFAKIMMESDESINKQIQANARNSGRSGTPVELDFTPTAMLKRKRRGSLSGLGGYFV